MHQHRTGESKTVPFRNKRYYCANGSWYFEARGGVQKGPFANKEEMQAELLLFIREQNMLNQSFRGRSA